MHDRIEDEDVVNVLCKDADSSEGFTNVGFSVADYWGSESGLG